MLLDLIDRSRRGNHNRDLSSTSMGSQPERNMATVLHYLEMDCELSFGREGERLLKTIKSEFGDIVLLITNYEIYEL